jgi:single stranded DNA-binding protein
MELILALFLLSLCLCDGFSPSRGGLGPSLFRTGLSMSDGPMADSPERSKIPQRRDVCRVFISGVIGTDPRENYLSNGHYVMNFALAVVGHFFPQHNWEEYKPTETMWISTEIWDNQARLHQDRLVKGAPMCGVGYLIHNKWQDKTTGEDRKMFKLRLTNILAPEDLADMLASSGIEDLDGESDMDMNQENFDEAFDDFNQDVAQAQSESNSMLQPPGVGTQDSFDDRIPF